MNLTTPMINLTSDPLIMKSYCTKLFVSYDYNVYIITNFLLLLFYFLNNKYFLYLKFGKSKKKVNEMVFLVLFVFNTIMLLFQFVVLPIVGLLGGQ